MWPLEPPFPETERGRQGWARDTGRQCSMGTVSIWEDGEVLGMGGGDGGAHQLPLNWTLPHG